MAACDHVVQLYEHDGALLDLLEGFVGSGINAGDCVIVIATAAHLKALEERLLLRAVRVDTLKAEDQYIPLDAEHTLSRFMVSGWPDGALFQELVSRLLDRARHKGRHVRAFGEMVALLWQQGHCGATVQLENLWNTVGETADFCLFCAYPRIGFTQDATASLSHICATHAKVVAGKETSPTELLYQSTEWMKAG